MHSLDRLSGELFTADAVGHWGDRDVRGPRMIAEQVRQAQQLFPGISTVLEVGPIAEGDLLAAQWVFTDTYAGGPPGAQAPVGAEVRCPGVDIFRIRGDRFCAYCPQGDNLSLMAQLKTV